MSRQLASPEQPGAPRAPDVARGLVSAMRPRQWLKNVLVLAAPAAAGVLLRPSALAIALGATGLFCIVSGATYLWNDSFDVEADQRHPTKRHRPLAAGVVPVPLARAVGTIGIALAIAGGWLLAGGALALVLVSYVAVTLAYSLWLKHEPVLDLAAVATGFVLRAVAGGVAVHVPLSDWFLIVTSFGSLFVVAGKRSAEQEELGAAPGRHRATLVAYSSGYLRYVRSLASAVAIAAYCVWAFQRGALLHNGTVLFEASIAPFVLAVLRYGLRLEQGAGGAPEEVFLSDRPLQLLGVAWIVLFALGISLG